MFQPVVPIGGVAGWAFLSRTKDTQQAAFNQSPQLARDAEYFRENIGDVTTAEELVSDRRLLGVALGAFGLDDDINNRYFIQKVLEDGTLETGALANRLADKRYLEFSQAFGFGDFSTARTQLSEFPYEIIGQYQTRQFEIAIGEQDDDMRLALNALRELPDIAEGSGSDTTKWFQVMGSEPLRRVFESALGLPSSFASLDLDKQLEVFRDKAQRALGTDEISEIAQPDVQEDLIHRFLVRQKIAGGVTGYSPAQTALTLLQNSF